MLQFVIGGLVLYAVISRQKQQAANADQEEANNNSTATEISEQQQWYEENSAWPLNQVSSTNQQTENLSNGQSPVNGVLPLYGTNEPTVLKDSRMMSTLNGYYFQDDSYNKKESEPFFSNTTYNTQNENIVNGSPAYYKEYSNRYEDMLNMKEVKNNELPFEQVHVGPGLALDPSVASAGGFQQGLRIQPVCYDMAKSKNRRDEMRPPNVNEGLQMSQQVDTEIDPLKMIGDFTIHSDRTQTMDSKALGIAGGSNTNAPHANSTGHSLQWERLNNCANNRSYQAENGKWGIGPAPTGPSAPTQSASLYRDSKRLTTENSKTGIIGTSVSQYDPTKTSDFIINDSIRGNELPINGVPGTVQTGNGVEPKAPHWGEAFGINSRPVNLRNINNGLNPTEAGGTVAGSFVSATPSSEGQHVTLSQRGSSTGISELPQGPIGGLVAPESRPSGTGNDAYTRTTRSVYENDPTNAPGLATGAPAPNIEKSLIGKTYTHSLRGGDFGSNSIQLMGPPNDPSQQFQMETHEGYIAAQELVSYNKESINIQLSNRLPAQAGSHNPVNTIVDPGEMKLRQPILYNEQPQLSKIYSPTPDIREQVNTEKVDNISSFENNSLTEELQAKQMQIKNNPWNLDINKQ
tara:strand:- start:19 stop:1917 length:1899 start_codon:yes stop_codon:yes gene_type:complete